MSFRFRAALLCPTTLALALVPTAAQAAPALRIACVELTLESGVSEGTRDLLYERLLAQVEAAGPHEVLGKTDIDTMLGLEEERQKLGCLDKASCIAEIGGALGVQQIISGNIGRIGESLLLNLKRIDVRRAKAVSRVSRRFKGGSEEQILDALPDIVKELFGTSAEITDHESEPAPAAEPDPAPAPERQGTTEPTATPVLVAGPGTPDDGKPSLVSRASFWGWLAVGVGVAAVLAGAGAGGYALKQQNDLESKRYNWSTYTRTVNGIESSALAADVLISIGAVAAAVGVVVLLVGGGDDQPAAASSTAQLEVLVSPAGLGLRGSF